MKYNEDAESEILFTPLISNFRTLSMTSKLELEFVHISVFFFIAMPLKKNAPVYQFFDIYWTPLLVSMLSSADNNILCRGKQTSYKISWKTQPKLLQKCTRTSVMRPVSKHKRATQHVRYNRSCHDTCKSLPWIVCRCNSMYKTTNTFNDKPLYLHVMSCCKQAWGRKVKKKKEIKAITIEIDSINDIIERMLRLIWAKEASFFCRSLFLFFRCYWKFLRDFVFFCRYVN